MGTAISNRIAAVRAGWPAHLRRREILVMNLMVDGKPRTAREICAELGLSWLPRRMRTKRPGGSTLAYLVSSGLLVRRRGWQSTTYSLAPGVKRREVRQ